MQHMHQCGSGSGARDGHDRLRYRFVSNRWKSAAAFRELNAELRQIDPAAFEYRDSWWPRVLDDVRHTRPRVLMENETPTWTASTGHTSKTCENGTNSMVLTPE
jgi:hypothetical protein